MKKVIPHFSNALFKLLLSFLGIICFTTILIGSLCAGVFNRNYRREIEKIYTMNYQKVYLAIEKDILEKATDIYLNICTKVGEDLKGYEYAPMDQSYSALYSLQQYLREYEAVYSDILSEISVYFEKENLLLSSLSGLLYFDRNPAAGDYQAAFLEEYRQSGVGGIRWVSAQMNPYNTDSFFTMSAPVLSSGKKEGAAILINISISRTCMEEILQKPSLDTLHFALYHQGEALVSTLNSQEAQALQELDKPVSGNQVAYCSNQKNIVFYQEVPEIRCVLFSVVDADAFYRNARFLQGMILSVCGVAILLSFLLSGMIARRLYQPIRRIISSSAQYSSQFSLSLPDSRNEYDYIDVVMNSLTFRLSQLQQTLSSNQQLIQYSVLMKMLTETGIREEFIRERLELLSMKFDRPYYYVVLAQLPAFSQDLSAGKYEFLYYQAIRLIQEKNSRGSECAALKTTDETIVVILNTEDAASHTLKEKFGKLYEKLREELAIEVKFLISEPSESLTAIHAQYLRVRALQQEFFVLPRQEVLTEEYLDSRVLSSPNVHDAFLQALQQRDLQIVREILEQIRGDCFAGKLSYLQVNRILLDILNIFAQFTKSLNVRLHQDLYDEFSRCNHIDSFCNWMDAVVDDSFRILNSKGSRKTSGVVAEVMDFITNHLEVDHNLASLAEQFHLSPNYLSRIFKEQVGCSLLDFINRCRLEQAAFYLEHTDLHIDAIARKAGFSHSTYFIKKFREKYGVTPKSYRLMQGETFFIGKEEVQ